MDDKERQREGRENKNKNGVMTGRKREGNSRQNWKVRR